MMSDGWELWRENWGQKPGRILGVRQACFPRAVNYGAAGSIMAHELLHIFYQLCE